MSINCIPGDLIKKTLNYTAFLGCNYCLIIYFQVINFLNSRFITGVHFVVDTHRVKIAIMCDQI